MRMCLDANIDGSALFIAGTLSTPFGSIAVAARLITALGAWRRVDSTLRKRRNRLSLNLRGCLGDILRHGSRQNRRWKRRNLHNSPELGSTRIIAQLLHARNEQLVNPVGINWILNKYCKINTVGSLISPDFISPGVKS